ncbi:MAG: sugar phosphate isomerase/epimerase family protein [Bryobacteraceae bacterium]
MLRRTFLAGGGAAAAASALPAAAPSGGIPLGFDSYSIGRLRWKAIELLDYAAGLKLDTIQLSSLGDYESLEPAHLQKVKDHADRLGIRIDAGTGCICPSSESYGKNQGDAREYLLKSLRVARAVGSKSMRCFMGSGADRRGKLPLEVHMENTVKLFRSVRPEAVDLGVKIALENHSGDMQAREVRTIIEEAGRDFVGACLDTGNAIWVCEDPMVTLEILAPYVLTTHIRDAAVFEHPRGAAGQWVALGDGSVDFKRFIARYRELCPSLPPVQLEIITGRKPQVLPYLEPDFWKLYPKMPAWELARFVALAKSGRPFLGDMLMVAGATQTPAVLEALKQQQKADLERSLEYAKKALGLGVLAA